MLPILQKENPVLRQRAEEVPLADITSEHIQGVIRNMQAAMHSQDDAVAIAAPQIGVSLRIFCIVDHIDKILTSERATQRVEPEDGITATTQSKTSKRNLVFINPEIIKRSKKTQEVEEGCLSVRWMYGKVQRAQKATIRAFDEKGKLFTIGGNGLMAQIFQHEIDHLNGKLFTDIASDVHDVPPEGSK